MRMRYRTQLGLPRQKGAILVVSLLMLLVMTLLGLAAMQVTRMQERMAGNSRDVNIAFQGSEAALRDGEDQVKKLALRPFGCVAAPCASVWKTGMTPQNMRNQNDLWWNTNSRVYGSPGVLDTVAEPQYVVEETEHVRDSFLADETSGRTYYRITARSKGATNVAQAIVESTYARQF